MQILLMIEWKTVLHNNELAMKFQDAD